MCRFDKSEHDQDIFKLVLGNIEDLYEKAVQENTISEAERDQVLESRFAALKA